MKLAIMSIYPTPYQDLTYKRLADIADGKIQIRRILQNSVDHGHSYQKVLEQLDDTIYLKNTESFIKSFKEIKENQLLEKYDLYMIPGHSRKPSIAALIYCIFHRIPFIYITDEISDNNLSWIKRIVKRAIIKVITNKANAIIVPGNASKEYFMSLNIPQDKIFKGAYCLDIENIIKGSFNDISKREDTRKALNVPQNAIMFIYAGRYLRIRDMMSLIKSFKITVEKDSRAYLLLIGDGEDKSKVLEYVKNNDVNNVIFMDFVKIEEIGAFYAASDVYVLTSILEHYSLACIQAAAYSLPLIITETVGAGMDILEDKVNGYFVKPQDLKSISNAMLNCVNKPDYLKHMGELSQKKVSALNLDWAANEMYNCITKVGKQIL